MPRIHIADLLCPNHRTDVLRDGWPGTATDCAGCRRRSEPHADTNGDIFLGWLDCFTPRRRRYVTAVHEAGHAVCGILAGMTAEYVEIGDGGDGRVHFRPGILDVDVSTADYLSMLWAGEQAALRQLADTGTDTPLNRIDVHCGARGDAALAYEVSTWAGLPDLAGRTDAADLVDRHWPAITTLAADLATRDYTDGAAVHNLVNELLAVAA